eukprot:jgi/Botrbrau1/3976/Bobra.0365s0048.1
MLGNTPKSFLYLVTISVYIHRLLGMLWIHPDAVVAHNKPGTNCMHIGLSGLFLKGLVMLGGENETSCMYGGHGEYWWG